MRAIKRPHIPLLQPMLFPIHANPSSSIAVVSASSSFLPIPLLRPHYSGHRQFGRAELGSGTSGPISLALGVCHLFSGLEGAGKAPSKPPPLVVAFPWCGIMGQWDYCPLPTTTCDLTLATKSWNRLRIACGTASMQCSLLIFLWSGLETHNQPVE